MFEKISSNIKLKRLYKIGSYDTLVTMCYPLYTLEGYVIGEYRTIIWEQISGPPVIWLSSPDQLSVDIEIPIETISEDRLFRLYANKGTPSQMYADRGITGIPTSYCVYRNLTLTNLNSLTTSISLTPFTLDVVRANLSNSNLSFNYDLNYSSNDLLLFWTPSNNVEYYIVFQKELNSEDWIEIARTDKGITHFLNPDFNRLYKIAAVNNRDIIFSNQRYTFTEDEFQKQNMEHFQCSSKIDYSNLSLINLNTHVSHDVRILTIRHERYNTTINKSIELLNSAIYNSYNIYRFTISRLVDDTPLESTLEYSGINFSPSLSRFIDYEVFRFGRFVIGG